ncbi:MAG: hypothetical protein IT158_26485 [Bryobacterales bacterium]|nr:hypothetical protein [Bryobacterales bacterium]
MKRRSQPKPEPVVSPEILEKAKRSVFSDKLKKTAKCTVCGAEASPANPDEDPLCWVCRRLKISAWHDSEQQVPAQE